MLITSRLLQMQKLFRKSSQLISNFIKLHKSQETQEMYKNKQQQIKCSNVTIPVGIMQTTICPLNN